MKETFLPDSSNLAQVDYDGDQQTLVVTFKTGNIYEYKNVPESVYLSLQRAPSPGSYFYRNVRSSYVGTQV